VITWVDVEGRDFVDARKKLLEERLLQEVVDANVTRGGNEEQWLRWMELYRHHSSFVLVIMMTRETRTVSKMSISFVHSFIYLLEWCL